MKLSRDADTLRALRVIDISIVYESLYLCDLILGELIAAGALKLRFGRVAHSCLIKNKIHPEILSRAAVEAARFIPLINLLI